MVLFFQTVYDNYCACSFTRQCKVMLINDDSLHTFNCNTMKYKAGAQHEVTKVETHMPYNVVLYNWLTYGRMIVRVPYFMLLRYFLTTLTLILTLNDHQGAKPAHNLINQCRIEKCHIKHLLLAIYSFCMYLKSLHIYGKQSTGRNSLRPVFCSHAHGFHYF